MLKEINDKLKDLGLRLRIKQEGVIRFLSLGNTKVADVTYASVQIKDRTLSECLKNLMVIDKKDPIKLETLFKAYVIFQEYIDE